MNAFHGLPGIEPKMDSNGIFLTVEVLNSLWYLCGWRHTLGTR